MSKDIAGFIDHTALGSEVGSERIRQLCAEAVEFGFKTIFVQPCRAKLACEALLDTGVGVGTVAGFPFGANTTETKVNEATQGVIHGVSDIDMVINVGWLKDQRWKDVGNDISQVVSACREAGRARKIVVKVIIETCLLNDSEKRKAALTIKAAGADFVKTSTGYLGTGTGANTEDVALLRATVGSDFGVKASGGIRTLTQLNALIDAGANRIGTSAGVKIMNENI